MSEPAKGCYVNHRKPWVATDQDCETGFLTWAPEGISPDEAVATFVELFTVEFGSVRSVDGNPLEAELWPYREPREDEEDAVLWPCARGEEPTEMVWVIEGIEWC